MSPDADFNFLEQKIRLLNAADRFHANLESAKAIFNYVRAINTLGAAAHGMRYFYDRSSNLLKYINGHKFFEYALALRAEQGQKHPEGQGVADNLSLSFSELQSAATDLHEMVIGSISRLMEVATAPNLKKASRIVLADLSQGSEILNTIKNAKPEGHWIELYTQGLNKQDD